jgi:hypothetical protein
MNAYIENINDAISYIENVYNKEERKEYFRSLENGPLSNLVHCITCKSKKSSANCHTFRHNTLSANKFTENT